MKSRKSPKLSRRDELLAKLYTLSQCKVVIERILSDCYLCDTDRDYYETLLDQSTESITNVLKELRTFDE